jgi:hypothetical protein
MYSYSAHADIISALWGKLDARFICTDIKNKQWWEFHSHRWMWMDTERLVKWQEGLRAEIDQVIVSKIQEYSSELSADNKSEFGKILDKINQLRKFFNGLQNHLLDDLATALYDPNFLEKLNTNYKLICFENGVYDLDKGVFRDGKPDDYLSLSTGYKYIKHHPDDERVDHIKKFLNQILPDKKVQDFLIGQFAECLGGISESTLDYFEGNYCNGRRTTLVSLIASTFGNYAIFPNENFLTLSSCSNSKVMNGIRVFIFPYISTNIYECLREHQHKPFLGIAEYGEQCELPTTYKILPIPFIIDLDGRTKASMTVAVTEWRQIFMSMLIDMYHEIKSDIIRLKDFIAMRDDASILKPMSRQIKEVYKRGKIEPTKSDLK